MPKKNRNADVFISYRREDGSETATHLRDKLIESGYSVFLDEKSIKPTEPFPNRLRNGISECSDFILIGTKAYLSEDKNNVIRINQPDDWVRKELSLAVSQKKNIIPISVELPELSAVLEKINSKTGAKGSSGSISSIKRKNFIALTNKYVDDDCYNKITDSFTKHTQNNRAVFALIRRLSDAPGEKKSNYPNYIKNVVEEFSKDKNLVSNLTKIMNDADRSKKVRFAAYYSVFTFYRRYKFNSKLISFVDANQKHFQDHDYNKMMLAQCYKLKYNQNHHKPTLIKAFNCSKECLKLFNNSYGSINAFADLVALMLESGIDVDEKDRTLAIKLIKKAIDETKYARYYCAYGRLMYFQGKYEDARQNITKAIDYEDTTNNDAFIRFVEYKEYLTNIKIMEMQKEIDELKKQIGLK